PQNNRGEISADIGELDRWGGHCGRADDYHYHAAPLHLQETLGKALPIAYALDGYPIYGLKEPDGSEPRGLDAFNGHTMGALGYHYHASTRYPFINGGFHGEVTELEGQVDPQPRAQPVRPALQALRGAEITGYAGADKGQGGRVTYKVGGKTGSVDFAPAQGGGWKFTFTDPDGTKREETYRGDDREGRRPGGEGKGGGKGGKGGKGKGPDEGKRPEGGKKAEPTEASSAFGMDALKKPQPGFVLQSADIPDPTHYPVEFTGDGAGVTPSLQWKGAPAGTRGFALVMDHLTPDESIKTCWLLWDLPATLNTLGKAAKPPGKAGVSSRGAVGYEPPHSQGPGDKNYVLTVYALSAPLVIASPEAKVTRDMVFAAMKGKVLGSASMTVTYSRDAIQTGGDAPAESKGRQEKTKGRKSGGPSSGLIKPAMTDTMKLNVYADNWFMLYVNGRLVAVDSIEFTPHNVISVDFLPEYPMTIAVLAKDNADPKTGMEYGTSIGDGGFCLKFSDGTVTDGRWKARNFFHGPVKGDTANPKVQHDPLPANWWTVDFDDSQWSNAREFSVEEVDPKQPYFDHDFEGAKFIWSADIALDNTVIFRTKVDKPGWKPRWNTKPDLDVRGVDAGAGSGQTR
ncbi:MAG: YHYH protein, partial [Verrucomicrobiota bacterium]